MTGNALQPSRITSPSGLVVHLNANGSLRRMEHGDIVLNLFPGNEVEGGPTNVYLRRLGAGASWTPLLGPQSPLAFQLDEHGLRATGAWQDVEVVLTLVLAERAPAWFWHLTLESHNGSDVTVDVIHAHDVALAHYGTIRMNEYYVSQYLDHVPLAHPARGTVLAVRQNLAMGGRHPWVVIGALDRAVSFATDALQFHGLTTRAGDAPTGLLAPSLPGVRQQHEHAMAVLQNAPVRLVPGAAARLGFFGWFEPDHAAATSPADLAIVDRALALPEASTPTAAATATAGLPAAATLFAPCSILRCRDLTDGEIAARWSDDLRHLERADGRLLSFFTGTHTHVALRAKESHVLRPHGHLLRTGDQLTPEEASLTTTAWMGGVFNALLTQGHVSINRFLSTTRSYLGLQRSQGQRIFVEFLEGYRLLDVPSAWEITPSACRWIYAHAAGVIEVQLTAALDHHALELTITAVAGPPARLLISSHVALGGDDGAEPVPVHFTREPNGVVVHAPPDSDVGRRFPGRGFRIEPLPGTVVERVGGDELLFVDGRSRNQPFLTIVTAPGTSVGIRVTGELVDAPARAPARDSVEHARFWTELAGPVTLTGLSGPRQGDVARLQEILPWFAHDALIHYLAPRGLEQYSGGGWGTRDVCQGPVELLLALGRFEPIRDLLLRVFENQNPDGDWPQWFMFFERERSIRPADSHGDIVFWPVHALAQYLQAAEDASILDAVVPFFDPAGADQGERAPLWSHVERALALMDARVIPGTYLAAYGHGDWNDSLQPVDAATRERLCSTWTVTLHHETLATLASALRLLGRTDDAVALEARAARIRSDFLRRLLVDGELAGFAYFHLDGRVEYLLHPRDEATGIHHRLLPMIHAILADLLTPEQAAAHIALIRAHLLGADGARLFDRPVAYRGGPQRHFQRAETSAFFGREIGLMYTHAHLRYAEAMAHYGDAEAFFEALRRAHPIGIRDVVATAAPRQASCYYSSSDAAVTDRYEAAERYADVRAGRVRFEGGWRVYSSGPGIAVRLIHQSFLGLRRGRSTLGVDPVIPKVLDGLCADVTLDGRRLRVRYGVAAFGRGPTAVTLNGHALPMTRLTNPYRPAGVTVPMEALRAHRTGDTDELVVALE